VSKYRLYRLIALTVHIEHIFQHFLQAICKAIYDYIKIHIAWIIISDLSTIFSVQAIRLFRRYMFTLFTSTTRLNYYLQIPRPTIFELKYRLHLCQLSLSVLFRSLIWSPPLPTLFSDSGFNALT